MSQAAPPRVDLSQLTGLRAFAALGVVIFHYSNNPFSQRVDYGRLQNLILISGRGVDLFFILSGLVISLAYYHRFGAYRLGAHGSFLWRRLARLLPLHWLTMAIVIAVVAYESPGVPFLDLKQTQPRFFLENLLFVNGWHTGGDHSINFVAWAASIEVLAYLFFPALVLIADRLGPRRHPVATLLVLLAVTPFVSDNDLLRLATEFPCGMCLHQIYFGDPTEGAREKALWRRLIGVARHEIVLGVIIALALWIGFDAAPWLPPLFALFVSRLVQIEDVWSRFLARRVFVYLGQASYALYMIHPLIGHAVATWETGTTLVLSAWILWPAVLALAQGLAVVVFLYVEEPARRALTAGRPASASNNIQN